MFMKKIVFSFVIIFCLNNGQAQVSTHTDSLFKLITAAEDDSIQVNAAIDLLEAYVPLNPDSIIYNANKLLELTQDHELKNLEALAYNEIGYGFWRLDNSGNGLEYCFKALKIAEELDNPRVLSRIYMVIGIIYKKADRAIASYRKSLGLLELDHADKDEGRVMNNMADAFYSKGSYDSALYYQQKAYAMMLKTGQKKNLVYIFTGTAGIYLKLENYPLALTYAHLALNDAKQSKTDRHLELANRTLSDYYKQVRNIDSTLFYARQAYTYCGPMKSFSIRMNNARNLSEIYSAKKNKDSVIKYLQITIAAKDSLDNFEELQKVQSLEFEEDLRQSEKAQEAENATLERRHHLQYAGIAVALIGFLILFFLLSRSILVKTKFIEFFGVLGLLAVFEFINLFIHPYLAHATNDSPVLMLVILIAIGALLVPLHHRLEKWMTKVMVEKNKRLRLAAAHKVIATLEDEKID